jgi:hypothetical protein
MNKKALKIALVILLCLGAAGVALLVIGSVVGNANGSAAYFRGNGLFGRTYGFRSFDAASPGRNGAVRMVSLAGVMLVLLYWLLTPVWVFLDARRRQTQPLPWALLVLLTNLVGLSVYWIYHMQNAKTEPARSCPSCGKDVRKGYLFCPWCAVLLTKKCKGCGKELEKDWVACPWCGGPVE